MSEHSQLSWSGAGAYGGAPLGQKVPENVAPGAYLNANNTTGHLWL